MTFSCNGIIYRKDYEQLMLQHNELQIKIMLKTGEWKKGGD